MVLIDNSNERSQHCVAAIFGVTGLVGSELARKLLSTHKWKVYGIARRPISIKKIHQDPNYHFISCDLLHPSQTQEKLSANLHDVTHVFWVTWASQFPLDTIECFEQNKSMMSNVLNAIFPTSTSLKHVSLQTGTKHYVSLREPVTDQELKTIFDENSNRVDTGHNFYYALEDLLQAHFVEHLVGWSIQRPGLIIGCSDRTLYNFIGSICVYGTICKHLKLPFVFGGTKQCWEEMHVDVSDARLVADQHIWASTNLEKNKNEAFNAINGEEYTYKEIWKDIGLKLGMGDDLLREGDLFSEGFVFSAAMADKGGVWKEIVAAEGLVETEMEDLANWYFLDVLFRSPVKMLGCRDKADGMGFKTRYTVLDSMFYWIDFMRSERFIP